jgi:hypothetical protein
MNRLFIIALLSLIFFSCKKESIDGQNANDNIQPLEVGFTWVFEDTYYSPEGQVLGKDTTKLGITGKTNINYENNEIEVFFWNWTSYPTHEYNKEKWLCSNLNNELSFYGGIVDDSLFVFEKTLAAKLPVTVNESWTRKRYQFSVASFYIAGESNITCKSTNESFETGIGKLDCVRLDETIDSSNDELVYETYYCINIGIVGVTIKRNEVIEITKKLISYDLTPLKSSDLSHSKQSNRKDIDNFNVTYLLEK